MNRQLEPNSNDSECPADWQARKVTPRDIWLRVVGWFKEQATLFEALWVAVSFHVLLFPILWFAGWALPWPKSPTITTVIEINLENWPNDARPEKIEELFTREMSRQAR